jgi:hypothetical protein
MNTASHQKMLLVFGRTHHLSFRTESTDFPADRTVVWFVAFAIQLSQVQGKTEFRFDVSSSKVIRKSRNARNTQQ